MGASPSFEVQKDFQQVYKAYNDRIFGVISIWEHRQNPEEKIFGKRLPSELMNANVSHNYQKRMKLTHQNLLKVYHIDNNSAFQSCMGNANQQLAGYWEYPGVRTLEDVIKAKVNRWSEAQFWEIIQQIVSACATLEGADLYCGDIRPAKLFIKNDRIKVVEQFLIPGLHTNYQCALFGEQVYLSPQQLECLKQKNPLCTAKQIKSDVFCFGITLIDLANLTNSLSCFNFNEGILLKNELTNKLQQVRQTYSDNLFQFILTLLDENEEDRPSFIQIEQRLVDYSSFIVPSKIVPPPKNPPQRIPTPEIKLQKPPQIPVTSQKTAQFQSILHQSPQISHTPPQMIPIRQVPIAPQQIQFPSNFAPPPRNQQYFQETPIYYQSTAIPLTDQKIHASPTRYSPATKEFTLGSSQQNNPLYITPIKNRSRINSKQSPQTYDTPIKTLDELDQRIERAVKLGQQIIDRHTPTK